MTRSEITGSVLVLALALALAFDLRFFLTVGFASGMGLRSVVAVCLTIGLAFTQSRTGLLSFTCLLVAVLVWRAKWRSRYVALFAIFLYALYWVLPDLLREFHQIIFVGGGGVDGIYYRPIQTEDLRIRAWKLFAAAILEHPWFGYGWTAITTAQVEVSNANRPLGINFAQAHNMFLDILLWLGIPLGLFLIIICVAWFVRALQKTKTTQGLACLLALMVVGAHSMLEFPLHYAFFLLPTGILIGFTNFHSGNSVLIKTRAWVLVVLWAVAGFGLVVTIGDYFRSEQSYYALRFEKARIGTRTADVARPPDVLVLTQLRDWIWAERVVLHRNMPHNELQILDSIAQRFPAGWTIYRIAKASAISSDSERAQYWVDRICAFVPTTECLELHKAWLSDQQIFSEMAVVHWNNAPRK